MQRSVHCDKMELVIALVSKAEAAVNNKDFAALFCVTKEFIGGRRSPDGFARYDNEGLLIYDYERLKRLGNTSLRFSTV